MENELFPIFITLIIGMILGLLVSIPCLYFIIVELKKINRKL